jgi:HEAT repeat protein
MKRSLALILTLVCTLQTLPILSFAAESDEEQRLIQVLQSAVGPGEKDAACARLKFIGTPRCIPALASLLPDEQLSHSARYALEPMPFPEAGQALLEAMAKTKGPLREGIINSLAVREEKVAIGPLIDLLKDADKDTAGSAARALGQIGGPDAATALREFARSCPPELHDATVDALLRCANRMLVVGQRSMALAIFEQLDAPEQREVVRVAAFRGRVGASGNAGLNMVLHAISGPAGPGQLAALQLARNLQVPHTTRELARLLPSVPQPIQIALIGCLGQRGDVSAVPDLKKFAATAGPGTWIPLIQAFDLIGDATVVQLLAGWAASGIADVQRAARQALADLHQGNITQAIIAQLASSSPEVQAELARALGARGDKDAVPRLVAMAQHGPDTARKSVLQALSVLVDKSQVNNLVDLVVQAKDPAARAQSTEALSAAYQRFQSEHGATDTSALVQGFERGSTDTRIALLPVCAGLPGSKVRDVIRAALREQEPRVHAAGVHALCDTVDGELLPDLLDLCQRTKEESMRSLAIGGAVRLVTQEDSVKLAPAQRISALKSLLADCTIPEQKRRVLAGLGEITELDALNAVEPSLDDASVRNEAARAVVKICSGVSGQTIACAAALKKALSVTDDNGTRAAVEASLNQLQAVSDYLTNWEVSGPYRQADKDFSALFDTPFPPETANDQAAKWRKLSAGADPKRPGVMDLLKALGGQECVGYARTWIHCDAAQPAVLGFGSDDGIKIWLNDRQVYALNVARPLQPGSDHADVTLKPGWNRLLLKVTQNNQGWEFCMRVRNRDGSRLEGVRCEAQPADFAK